MKFYECPLTIKVTNEDVVSDTNLDVKSIDSDRADLIIQLALFNEVVFD